MEARGSWRAKINPAEPKPQRGKPACPRRLTKPQRELWKKLVDELDRLGVLTVIDGKQLERYCTYFVRWRECEDFIAKNGMTYPLKSAKASCYVGMLPSGEAVVGFVEYPQVKESHRLDHALKQIEMAFGLTPSARTRLTVEPQSSEPDKMEIFFSAKDN